MLVGAALGLKGCEGQAKTVVPPTDGTEQQVQTPQVQTIEVNFPNGSSQLSQEDIVKLQNLPQGQYDVVVKGNQYQWHINGQPCDPATNQRLQQNLDNQRAETIKQCLPGANVTITNPGGTQANATVSQAGNGTYQVNQQSEIDAANYTQQQGQQTLQVNESDIVRMVQECVKKIKEGGHDVLDPDEAAEKYKDTPYGKELARRAKNAKYLDDLDKKVDRAVAESINEMAHVIDQQFGQSRFPGSFEKAIVDAWKLASSDNKHKLEGAFPELFPSEAMYGNSEEPFDFRSFPHRKAYDDFYKGWQGRHPKQ